MNKLKVLQIETTNKCNAKCIFCPHQQQKKYRPDMSINLFKKIIDETKILCPEDIYPFFMGELFLDETIIDKIIYINQELPKTRVCIFTNGSILPEREEFKKIRIDYFNFSLNAINNKDRMLLMNIPLTKTLENIMFLRKTYPSADMRGSCILDSSFITNDKLDRFQSLCGQLGIMPAYFFPGNWAGRIRKQIVQGETCARIKEHLAILSDGTACMCCQDAFGEVVYGNLNENSLLDVWNNKERLKYQEFNDKGERNKIPICKNCTAI